MGAFTYLETHWPAPVVYAVLGDLRAERVAMGWGSDAYSADSRMFLRGPRTVQMFCDDILRRHQGALHLVAGLSSTTGSALSLIVRETPPERVAVFSERPGAYGPPTKRLLARLVLPIKYAWLVRRYRKRVGLLLPLGGAGLNKFVSYGWPSAKAARFMYCPPLASEEPCALSNSTGSIRFLYVGRLSRFTKGTDVLMKAADRLHGDWSLTIVGGHGDLVERVNRWAAGKRNVDVMGAATPEEVWAAMASHDLCVVPSRFDGWNVVVNEALCAGRGVIVTDEAVSDELVDASGGGIVVKAKSPRSLATAMQRVIDTPSLAARWGQQAAEYRLSILPDNVGGYLLEVLEALAMGSRLPTAEPPWLRGKRVASGDGENE